MVPGKMQAPALDNRVPEGADLATPFEAVLFDLDGVLYLRDNVVPAAPAALAVLRDRGQKLGFITNNAMSTNDQVASRLTGMGIQAGPAEVFTSAQATVRLLGGPAALKDLPLLVIGERGLREPLLAAGAQLLDPLRWDEARVVVVGLDSTVTYGQLQAASFAIAAGARFVGSNPDRALPSPHGPMPGAGALLALLETTTGVRPEIAGKPQAPLFETAAGVLGGAGPLLMIGDRAETDLVGAAQLGWSTALVLTGVTSVADLIDLPLDPDYVLADVGALTTAPPPCIVRVSDAQTAAVAARAGWSGRGDALHWWAARDQHARIVAATAWSQAATTARAEHVWIESGAVDPLCVLHLLATGARGLIRAGAHQLRGAADLGAVLQELGFTATGTQWERPVKPRPAA